MNLFRGQVVRRNNGSIFKINPVVQESSKDPGYVFRGVFGGAQFVVRRLPVDGQKEFANSKSFGVWWQPIKRIGNRMQVGHGAMLVITTGSQVTEKLCNAIAKDPTNRQWYNSESRANVAFYRNGQLHFQSPPVQPVQPQRVKLRRTVPAQYVAIPLL